MITQIKKFSFPSTLSEWYIDNPFRLVSEKKTILCWCMLIPYESWRTFLFTLLLFSDKVSAISHGYHHSLIYTIIFFFKFENRNQTQHMRFACLSLNVFHELSHWYANITNRKVTGIVWNFSVCFLIKYAK